MILTQQEFHDCLMSGTFNDRRRLSAHNVEMEATRKAHIAVESQWLLIRIDRDNLLTRIAELTDALTAEQERHANMTRLFDESDRAVKEKDVRIAELEQDLTQSRVQETRNYLASPAMETFAELKHSQAGTVLAMLGDGAISRGKCCEALAQLAHGVPFDEIPLPQENGRQFTLDEIPAEVVAKLETEARELREKLEAAEKDTARLDWLQSKAIERGNTAVEVDLDGSIDWWVYPGNAIGEHGIFAATLRSGIDAAMSAADQEQG